MSHQAEDARDRRLSAAEKWLREWLGGDAAAWKDSEIEEWAEDLDKHYSPRSPWVPEPVQPMGQETGTSVTIARYQACVQKLLDMWPSDPIPAFHPAQTLVERLEALIDLGLLGPTQPTEQPTDLHPHALRLDCRCAWCDATRQAMAKRQATEQPSPSKEPVLDEMIEALRFYATAPRDDEGATMPLDRGERARKALGIEPLVFPPEVEAAIVEAEKLSSEGLCGAEDPFDGGRHTSCVKPKGHAGSHHDPSNAVEWDEPRTANAKTPAPGACSHPSPTSIDGYDETKAWWCDTCGAPSWATDAGHKGVWTVPAIALQGKSK